jgi:hypothetical protein
MCEKIFISFRVQKYAFTPQRTIARLRQTGLTLGGKERGTQTQNFVYQNIKPRIYQVDNTGFLGSKTP